MLFNPPTPASDAVHLTAASAVFARSQRLDPLFHTFTKQNHALGTAQSFEKTDSATAPGWLSARRPLPFLAGRMKSLGTELHSLFNPMRRAAPGWLSARPSDIFKKQILALGTAQGFVKSDAEAAPGWLSASASESFSPESYHLPVLPAEVSKWMDAGPGKFIIDGTLGGGGHSELLLETGAHVLGVDRDPEALAHATQRLATFSPRFTTHQSNFSEIHNHPEIQNGKLADGLLLDLGVSSRQLDSAQRGFSFMREGPLDMRMGPATKITAAQLVNTWPETEITRILFSFGEEPKARRIAAAIVKHRHTNPFNTTLQLANFIESTVERNSRIHPATRTFQAIRMAVNEELESLSSVLSSASQILKPGGRLLIITFHSLEDRMVKRFLRHHSNPFIDDPTWPEQRPNPDCRYRLLARKAIAPTPTETSSNPRARSAKLRVAQLLEQ